MHTKRLILGILLCLMSAVAAGCVGTTAPQGWLPSAESSGRDAYGAWARITLMSPNQLIDGELIAVAPETVYVMTDNLIPIPRDSVRDIKLTRFQQEHSPLALWTVFGTLSTISHGFFLGVSAPAWIISGSVATGVASKEPIVHPASRVGRGISTYELQALAKYSRFPQGIPHDLDRSKMSPR